MIVLRAPCVSEPGDLRSKFKGFPKKCYPVHGGCQPSLQFVASCWSESKCNYSGICHLFLATDFRTRTTSGHGHKRAFSFSHERVEMYHLQYESYRVVGTYPSTHKMIDTSLTHRLSLIPNSKVPDKKSSTSQSACILMLFEDAKDLSSQTLPSMRYQQSTNT